MNRKAVLVCMASLLLVALCALALWWTRPALDIGREVGSFHAGRGGSFVSTDYMYAKQARLGIQLGLGDPMGPNLVFDRSVTIGHACLSASAYHWHTFWGIGIYVGLYVEADECFMN